MTVSMFPIACGICGDPSADTMLVQAALAGGMSLPFIFRDNLTAFIRRRLGRTQDADSCPLPPGPDAAPSDEDR
jgi:hypothetical protein